MGDGDCVPIVVTYKTFLTNYFDTDTPDMSVENVFKNVFRYMTQQWYFSDNDESVLFNPQTDFLDMAALVKDGVVDQVLTTAGYLRKLLDLLIQYYTTSPDPHGPALVTVLQTIYTLPDLGKYIPFPELALSTHTDSVLLTIPYVLDEDDACTDAFKEFIAKHMQYFYKDDLGIYTLGGASLPLDQTSFVREVANPDRAITMNGYGIGFTYTVEMKMSYSMMLRALSKQRNTFNTKTTQLSDYTNMCAGPSVPIPIADLLTNGCQGQGPCRCLYYVAFGPFECPGYSYYYCQFEDRCKCTITRAVPFTVSEQDRINNPFGQCFDINCADQGASPKDCQDQCAQAKEWLTSPNWAVDFINPAAVDIALVEKTCNFKVPQFSWTTNAYFWTWEIIAGGVCMLLTVPILVAMESWARQKFSLRFVHVVAFVFLVAAVLEFGYAMAGVQICADFGDPVQAMCVDRLTQSVVMNHYDCDYRNPVFCQCDASTQNMKPCTDLGMSTCKCQNNQLCLPGSGDDDVLTPNIADKKRVRWQLVYFCMGVFCLAAACLGVVLYYLVNAKGPAGYVPTVSLGLNVTLHLILYLVLFCGIVVGPVAWKYTKEFDQTWTIDPNKQTKLCTDV
jgi:hypothetical protein